MSNIKINDLGNTGAELFEDADGVMTELQDNELGLTGGLFRFKFGKRKKGKKTRKSFSFSKKSKKSFSFSFSFKKSYKKFRFFW